MADDLDEEWWLNNQDEPQNHSDDGRFVKLTEDEAKENEKDVPVKRKLTESSNSNKKRKWKRRKITEELKQNAPKQGEAKDVMAAIQKHCEAKLTAADWEQMKLDSDHFFDSNTDSLRPSIYLKLVLPKWSKMLKKKKDLKAGCPLVLIIASSAIRSVELIREIAPFKGEGTKTAKLFAKHFKLKEQTEFLSKTVIHIGVGTPNRINALLTNGALKLKTVNAVVIDWNWRDVKSHRLVDIPEVFSDLMVLFKTFLCQHLQENQCKIGLM
ncbi:protein CMSS1 [Octopus bimaculoides]|uniref:Protein CMSS1 n=1 Tax=Octopus bimaculoides TaxID=37653 RepID=A0A0L8II28_OCTBM|nr:protein CMSS1 [Octopus bimaculoides]|eukprot:XP_014782108.1 PREDICTED: protein CMSS1-like [Octopus bimaculoides]